MRRIFVPRLAEKITLTGGDAHHLGYAMRAKVGDELIAADADRRVARLKITAFTADTVELVLLENLAADTESPLAITLAVGLPKADKLEFIVQKAVELGVTAVQPLQMKNSVVRYDAPKAAARLARWQKIADEAAKQCGRTALAEVRPIMDYADWLKTLDFAADGSTGGCFAYENETTTGIGEFLAAAQKSAAGKIREIIALVGPEGGFDPAEAAAAASAGLTAVSLGPRILRAETAAVTVAALLQYALGDLGGRNFAPEI